ncbi:hypothetical protein PC9H_009794 [Pleurotus ostreatus]|uniref:L-arabinokinase n=1 Tax=Pleurotus ostreatus TaxID=5322 RepID=A0A8H6ZPR0_PLEOS|nr:uncharacterized protein PC9H_009794 [Pleurotus ostreatus]KAF7424487.1 hypothetical protein PC9H_009794 [Pleurotus ostreatus]KAJ8692558.1 hypothetical protein PTI98_009860 [Pleurotus ostreatus]
MPLRFAYYCSGHGYGHATRVSAFACHLLSVPSEHEGENPTICIVSSAPKHVFADSIARGAEYRYAEIDPVIVQPLAYRVDRQKSVQVLKRFLDSKNTLLETEKTWLRQTRIDCVLSDAAFLGCLAAKSAGIPSILITNFTFDSVYSYLSTSFIDGVASPEPAAVNHLRPPHRQQHPQKHTVPQHHRHTSSFDALIPDNPIPLAQLVPLVEQIHHGYRCADLLLLLPGAIPIPSFAVDPPLPSPDWVDINCNRFRPEIIEHLIKSPASYTLHPPVQSPSSSLNIPRSVIKAPLLVRPPSSSIYTQSGRSKLLSSIGVPPHYHNASKTRILIVSFGGQVFRRPSRTPSRSTTPTNGSRSTSPERKGKILSPPTTPKRPVLNDSSVTNINGLGISDVPSLNVAMPMPGSPPTLSAPSRIATPSHIWIPGAPPASKPPHMCTPPVPCTELPVVSTIPPTPNVTPNENAPLGDPIDSEYADEEVRLLPDLSWIAIVCGVSKEQWNATQKDGSSELPDGFYVAPRDVYMPDLTAVGDVLLGKLGYGTVSECVDACTPFVYVSRPLFIEEHGLRLLLEQEGVGVELSRQSYEAGDWASAVEEAFARGTDMKARKRKYGDPAWRCSEDANDGHASVCGGGRGMGSGAKDRQVEGREMAAQVMDWIKKWT